MKLVPTRRTDYGIRALLHLAMSESERVKAAEIAQTMDIPVGFLHQVLQQLQRTRLVTSRPGRSGGYSLARPAVDITILEIVEALEGPISAEECVLRGGPCHWEDVCSLHWVWSSAQAALSETLASATLAQVAEDDRALAAGTKELPEKPHSKPRRTRATKATGGRG